MSRKVGEVQLESAKSLRNDADPGIAARRGCRYGVETYRGRQAFPMIVVRVVPQISVLPGAEKKRSCAASDPLENWSLYPLALLRNDFFGSRPRPA